MYREADKEVYELYDSFVQRVLVDKKDFFNDSDDLLLTSRKGTAVLTDGSFSFSGSI